MIDGEERVMKFRVNELIPGKKYKKSIVPEKMLCAQQVLFCFSEDENLYIK